MFYGVLFRGISCLIIIALSGQEALTQTPGGVFTDKTGNAHKWTINQANCLIWNQQPYIPVGVAFTPQFLNNPLSDTAWANDASALDKLKSCGVLDIYIKPSESAIKSSAQTWQKLIDHLDSKGFRYGIQLNGNIDKPLTGWVIRPNVHRLPDVTPGTSIPLNISGLKGGRWIIADSRTSDIKKSGQIPSTGVIDIPQFDGKGVLVIYPIKTISPESTGLQNLWDGYPDYRDRLNQAFSSLKPGPGMRFWLDPFRSDFGFRNEAHYCIPTSALFQIEFEAWLRKKYPLLADLNRAWGLSGSAIKSHQEAGRVIPLWQASKGVPYLLDTKTGAPLKADVSRSAFWNDLSLFITHSIRRHLNEVSIVLKRQIANVPVVVSASGSAEYFKNDDLRGFDGIGIQAFGNSSAIGRTAAELGIAQIEYAKRNIWIISSEFGSTNKSQQSDQVFSSMQELTSCVLSLRDAGVKGFFCHRFTDTEYDASLASWIAQVSEFTVNAKLLSDWTPRIIWYSAANPLGASTMKLEKDLWWLPAPYPAVPVRTQPGVRAYSIQEPQGTFIYLWSVGQPKTLEISLPVGIKPILAFTGIDERQEKIRGTRLQIPLTSSPVVIKGLGPDVFASADSLMKQIERLTKLIAKAETRKIAVGAEKQALENAKSMIRSGRIPLAATTISQAMEIVEPLVSTLFWAEGENASETSFDGVTSDPMVSETKYLYIDTKLPPPVAPYCASFPIFSPVEADYEIWLAGSIPGAPGISPLSWSVDGSTWNPVGSVFTSGSEYAPGFSWSRLASVHLLPGRHVLRLKLDGKGEGSDTYRMFIDAVVISRSGFTPRGIERPEIE